MSLELEVTHYRLEFRDLIAPSLYFHGDKVELRERIWHERSGAFLVRASQTEDTLGTVATGSLTTVERPSSLMSEQPTNPEGMIAF